ncbi:MAG TPA: DUF4349 domain-containing protein [Actinomycetota bacterium]
MGKRMALGVAGFLAVAALAGAACSRRAPTTSGSAPAGAIKRVPGPMGPASRPPRVGPEANGVPAADLPAIGPRIVKTASLSLRVKDGTFEQRFQDATLVAGRYGGYVSSSETATGKHHSGTLVLRVPADRFEAALGDLKRLGTVGEERVSGQDVTAQFVDLQARLRNWRSQEAVLLGLMSKATSIGDSIRVQDELQQVQLDIEEIQGQLRVLSDESDLSTITVGMAEAGFVQPKPKEGSAIARAWHNALDGFVGVIAAVMVALGYVLPIGLFALIGWVAVRRMRPRPAGA